MRLEGSALLPAAREKVYESLTDPAFLAKCLPGAQELTPDGPGRYKVSLKMAIAAFSGKFQGAVHLADERPPESFRMAVEGRGAPGFMKGEGTLTLFENHRQAPNQQSAQTEVRYDGEAQVGGVVASVGSRMIEAAAKKIIQQFFDAAAAQLSALAKAAKK
ncbi:MAG TPA: carbon monoxide dehydrogenase subunit G [Candidatus Acidoferrales bacterium]|nr:carbon monoxide dehydrogenase subunit G [Candidatus Acidoferrales bacterium]